MPLTVIFVAVAFANNPAQLRAMDQRKGKPGKNTLASQTMDASTQYMHQQCVAYKRLLL